MDYWRSLGREYDRRRLERWRAGGPEALAADWCEFFAEEPQADVNVDVVGRNVVLDIKVCPAIKHLRDHHRDIVPYFCEHCDHVCGVMAEQSGYTFQRSGGDGACRQEFISPPASGEDTPPC